MAHLDRSILAHLGSSLRPEYESLTASRTPGKLWDLLFRYGLAEAALEAEGRSQEVRLRLRENNLDLLSGSSSEVAA